MKWIVNSLTWLCMSSQVVLAMPIIHESEVFYKINGKTIQALRLAMNHARPHVNDASFDAKTRCDMQWHVTYQASRNFCYISKINVFANIVTQLPQWAQYNNPNQNQNVKDQWRVAINKLSMHEKVHRDYGKNTATEIEETLKSLPPSQDCQTLKKIASEKVQQIVLQYKIRDAEFDRLTDHGTKAG